MSQNNRTIEEMIGSIAELDLDCVKFKLMDKREGQGWTRAEADHCEQEYKRFLTLIAKFPDDVIVPSGDVDRFWHGHILDTRKYAEDCQRVFGYFVHHFPYFGMRGEEDEANAEEAIENTRRLYAAEYDDLAGGTMKSSYCSRALESSYCSRALESSYCSRAPGNTNAKLKENIRPTLSPA